MTENTAADSGPAEAYPSDWSLWARRLAVILLLAGLVLIVFFFGPVLKAAIMALILTYLLYFPIRFLTRRTRLSHGVATTLVIVLFLLLLLVFLLVIAAPLTQEVTQLTHSIRTGVEQATKFLQNYKPDQGWLRNPQTGEQTVNLNFVLQPVSDLVQHRTATTDVQPIVSGVGAMAGALSKTLDVVGGTLGTSLLVVLLAILFLLEIPEAVRWINNIMPESHSREYTILGQRIARKWNGFVKAAVATAVLIGVLNAVQMLALGIPSALVVGFVSAVLGLIPILGGVVSLVIIVLVALAEGSTTLAMAPLTVALLAAGINLVVQSIVWHVVFPMLSKGAVALPLPIIVMGIIAGAAMGGMLGAFLVTPLLGILRELIEFVIKKIRTGAPFPDEEIAEPLSG
jgi:predicted PurR-regulated permease PerM